MKKTLFANGDSWTFGSEIMAPEFCVAPGEIGTGMGNRYKKGYDCWQSINDFYRIPRIWPSQLAELMDIPEVVNLSRPARSNDTIYENTVDWLLENYISKGRDTSELLVVIGWSSPERKNIIIEDDVVMWLTLWPSQPDTQFYKSNVIREFFKFYVTYMWVEQEYLKRYVEQNFQLQTFCKTYDIDYYCFNAFYVQPNSFGPESWRDIDITEKINNWQNVKEGWLDSNYDWPSIKRSLINQWSMIDKKRFVNKDSKTGSFRSYIYDNVHSDIRMCNWHPSPASHLAWAKYLRDYILGNQ